MDPPCEGAGGILKDGTCQFGMPEVLPENKLALRLFRDINLMGAEMTMLLSRIEIDDYERGDLLSKLRTLNAEVRTIQAEKIKKVANG